MTIFDDFDEELDDLEDDEDNGVRFCCNVCTFTSTKRFEQCPVCGSYDIGTWNEEENDFTDLFEDDDDEFLNEEQDEEDSESLEDNGFYFDDKDEF